MKQPKPTNSVTRRMEAMMSGPDVTDQLPIMESGQVATLEKLYPPRTLGRSESAEEHLRYAGKVELIEGLRARSDNHFANLSADDDGEGDDLAGAERVS